MIVRPLEAGDVERLNRDLPVWNTREYARRLRGIARGELVQLIAWEADRPVGRGMLLLPEHEEYSISASRERCAEVRDVSVVPEHRRAGVATSIMSGLESAALEVGMQRIGLSVSLDDKAAPARELYERLGYRHGHGPFVTSTILDGDDGSFPVGATLVYLVKDL